MIQKCVAALAALLFVAALASPASGQASQPAGAPAFRTGSTALPAAQPAPPTAASGRVPAAPAALQPGNAAPGARTDCPGGNCDLPQPHITIATPAPAPAAWTWQQEVSWAANLVLVVLGYVAIMLALSLLRKIERQTRFTEEAAVAAAKGAGAVLKLIEARERAERPWILISVKPIQNVENAFTVFAVNRGKGPARILTTVDELVCTIDESRLDPTPVFTNEPAAPADSIILLPGESTDLLSFSRDDVRRVCATEERFRRVENWEEKIFLYGKLTYRDLAAPDDAPEHESSWFCWYIHGRQKSGMVLVGPPGYNRHT